MVDRVWRAASADALRIEALGDLVAIFDRRSMQTHLVISPVPEMLAALAAGPCNAAGMVSRLAASFDIEGDGDAAAVVADRLAELAAMGLVEVA